MHVDDVEVLPTEEGMNRAGRTRAEPETGFSSPEGDRDSRRERALAVTQRRGCGAEHRHIVSARAQRPSLCANVRGDTTRAREIVRREHCDAQQRDCTIRL